MDIVNVKLMDQTGAVFSAKWFHMSYLQYQLKAGNIYVFRGKVSELRNHTLMMEQPRMYDQTEYQDLMSRLQPVYPSGLKAKIKSSQIGRFVRAALEDPTLVIEDHLTEQIRQDYKLCGLKEAYYGVHLPESKDDLIHARNRIVFEEFYQFISHMNELKKHQETVHNHFAINYQFELEQLTDRLPYELTQGQQDAIRDITADFGSDHMMNRLLQGDVGSGKTIVAFLTMYLVSLNHYQSALMAPTEVLATQHYEAFLKMREMYGLPIHPVLLTGSMTAAEKKKVYALIADGSADMIIGTHALIQEKVVYRNLAYVITDEQHRFGVKQRDALKNKGLMPHVLVMSATPIPRTLAMILYADLDISIIPERPKNRLPIKNCVIRRKDMGKAYGFIRRQVEEGHQAYVICPLIDESEVMDSTNVMDEAEELREVFKQENYRIEVLHGRMKQAEKNEVMQEFAAGRIQILVSTTVIEVGIDVANATVILIENADSFGLAQLHQLRGRVGRSELQSYCILIDCGNTEESSKRLDILNHSNDGFYIASEDLKMRGPGDFFGIRQSGEIQFTVADIYTDSEMLKAAAMAVQRMEETS